MASLRFNYDGDKRPEKGRLHRGFMPKNMFFQNTSLIPPPRPSPTVIPPPAEIQAEEIPESPAGDIEPSLPKPEKQGMDAAKPDIPSPETPPEINLSDSEKFIARLESYESGAAKIRQQIDMSRVLFDEVLFHMDSFLKILEVLRDIEERKQKTPEASVSMEKTGKDAVDEILDLLQTPAFQNILRQFLMGLLSKK